jgi:hypothetical protein
MDRLLPDVIDGPGQLVAGAGNPGVRIVGWTAETDKYAGKRGILTRE